MTVKHECKCGHAKYQHSCNSRVYPVIYTWCRIEDCACKAYEFVRAVYINARQVSIKYKASKVGRPKYMQKLIYRMSELGPDGKAF